MNTENVAVLGASDKADRYSNMAIKLLKEFGHRPIPVNPTLQKIEGFSCYKDLIDLAKKEKKIDTLTVYVNPRVSTDLSSAILQLKPGRVIFNPGSENLKLTDDLDHAGIPWENACTLVLLRTGQF